MPLSLLSISRSEIRPELGLQNKSKNKNQVWNIIMAYEKTLDYLLVHQLCHMVISPLLVMDPLRLVSHQGRLLLCRPSYGDKAQRDDMLRE